MYILNRSNIYFPLSTYLGIKQKDSELTGCLHTELFKIQQLQKQNDTAVLLVTKIP